MRTVVESLDHVSTEDSPYSPLWTRINRLMVLAIVLAVIYSYIRTKDADGAGGDGPVTREYLVANLQLYGFLFVGILFLNRFQTFVARPSGIRFCSASVHRQTYSTGSHSPQVRIHPVPLPCCSSDLLASFDNETMRAISAIAPSPNPAMTAISGRAANQSVSGNRNR